MELMEAIKTRRSIGLVQMTPIPKEKIEQVLEAGTYAPCHHRTEPWRFFVVTEGARNRLGEVLGEIVAEGESSFEEVRKKSERAKKNPLRAPVIIAVAVEPSEKSQVMLQEEYAAVHSAVQNMLLAAHGLGLGAIWRTGELCYHPKVKEFFHLSEKGEMVGFVYLGYPDMVPKERKPTSFKEKTVWIHE